MQLLITSDFLNPASYLNVGDFAFFWGAPQIARTHIAILFSVPDYMAALQALYPGGAINYNALPYAYPLHSLFFYAPFSLLPYLPSLIVWTGFGLCAYGFVFLRLIPPQHRRFALLLALLAPACFICVMTRQNGLFIAAGALGVLALLQHQRPVFAGILLGILTIKPHLFLLWPLILLLEKQWRCIAAASVTTLLLVGASFAVHGLSAWLDYLTLVPHMQWKYTSWSHGVEPIRMFQLMMPGSVMALRLIGASIPLTLTLSVIVALGVVLGMLRVWRRDLPLDLKAILLASGGMLVTPYGYNYDLPFLSAALLMHWLSSMPSPGMWRLVSMLAFLLPVLVYPINFIGAPFGPVILFLTFLRAAHEARNFTEIKS